MTDASGQQAALGGGRVGPIALASGVAPRNLYTYLYAAFVCIGMLAGLNVLQSYVLVEHLQIPKGQQGTVTGQLAVWQEATALLLIYPLGILADRIGRRPVMVFGILALAAGLALYPFAQSIPELTAYRVICAVGAAALGGLLAVVGNDYPAERSRGRLHGIAGTMNGLGVLFTAALIGRIPSLLRDRGVDAVAAGEAMFLTAAALCFVSAFVFQRGLLAGTGVSTGPRPPLGDIASSGIRAMRNPRVALSYACAFAGRADNAIKGTFISMWALSVAAEAGLSSAQAQGRAGLLVGLLGIVAIFWAPTFGWILDRVDRVTGVAIAMGLAGVGYTSMAFITSPLDWAMLPVFIVLALGQVSAITASVTLVGQEAPAAERGAVIAMSGWFGALGIMVMSYAGGRLFDSWGPFAPFVLVGVTQLVLCGCALLLRRGSERPARGLQPPG